ncbi:MAG: hypothetical protein EPN88_10875 [Bacteroidetes bacterium]|nr:MAG: hypothetical protein EPN88_10875 [Bacteroidota bacterium]
MSLTLTATRPDANHINFSWDYSSSSWSFLLRSIDNTENWHVIDGEVDSVEIAKCFYQQNSRQIIDYFPTNTQYWRVAVISKNDGSITYSSYIKVDPYVTQDYYAVRCCGDLNDGYYIGPFPDGTFSSGRRITTGTTFYVITGSQHQPYTNRSLLSNVQDTGQYGCP